jgi:AcrR family transcriptional regulator
MLFARATYANITADDLALAARVTRATFYNTFLGKSAWAAAVIDDRLNEALDQRLAVEDEVRASPPARLLGYISLLDTVVRPLPGIAKSLLDERTQARQRSYGELLPRFHAEMVGTLQAGQISEAFRSDIAAADLADFVLDSMAVSLAVNLPDRLDRAEGVAALLVQSVSLHPV